MQEEKIEEEELRLALSLSQSTTEADARRRASERRIREEYDETRLALSASRVVGEQTTLRLPQHSHERPQPRQSPSAKNPRLVSLSSSLCCISNTVLGPHDGGTSYAMSRGETARRCACIVSWGIPLYSIVSKYNVSTFSKQPGIKRLYSGANRRISAILQEHGDTTKCCCKRDGQ
jgi:hypothetical protein